MQPSSDLATRLVSVCRSLRDHCQYLEIRVEESASTGFSVQDGEVESVSRRFERGGNVRALVAGAWGFTTFNHLEDVEDMARAAIAQARLVGGGPVVLAPVEPVVGRFPAEFEGPPDSVSLEAKVAQFRSLTARMLAEGSPIATAAGFYGDRQVAIWLATSEGTDLHHSRLDVTAGVSATAQADGMVQRFQRSSGDSRDVRQVLGDLSESEAVAVARTAAELTRARKPEAGDYTVVIDPHLAGVFAHEAIGHLSEADHVSETPRLREVMELGREMGPPGLDIYDTGLLRGSRGETVYDEEGVPGRLSPLITDGRLVGRLHSRETAGMMGEQPTGSARAISYRHPPIVRMRTTCIGPGTASHEEIFKGIKRGIYCVGSLGGQTNMEMFTFTAARGYLIEDGEPGELLRDVTLTGNTFKTLGDIEAIEAGQQATESGGGCGKGGQSPLPVGFAAPHLRIREVRIGGE